MRWRFYLSFEPSFSIKSCRGASSRLSIRLNSWEEKKMKKYTHKHTQLLSCSIRLVVIRRRSSKQPSALSEENSNSSCSWQPVLQTDYTETQLKRQLSAMLSSIWQANLPVSALDSSEVTTHADVSHHLREITHFHLIHFLAQCLRNDDMQASVRLYHTWGCKV